MFAIGSMVSGLAYGAMRWRSSLQRRFLVAVLILALSSMLLVLIPSIPLLVPFAFLVGLSISPTIVAAWFGGVAGSAHQLTEGLTWATTGVGFGIAIGSSLAGRVVEAAGAHAGYAVTLRAGVATAIIVIAGWRWLRPPKPRTAPCLSTMSPPPTGLAHPRLPSSSPRGDCRWTNWGRNQRAHPARILASVRG